MSRRYVLAPQAAHDLVEIWRYLSQEASKTVADQVELAILTNSFIWPSILATASTPGSHIPRCAISPSIRT
jgi:hypothetical protein